MTVLLFLSELPAQGVQAGDLARIQEIFSAYPLNHQVPRGITLEELFEARTYAHRTRNIQIFNRLINDPQFLIQFPEYNAFVSDQKSVIEIMYEHDAGKQSADTFFARKILARSQGFYKENLPVNMPLQIAEEAKGIIQRAIDDINEFDEAHMQESFVKNKKSRQWVELFQKLMDTIDFYDTFKFRTFELANGQKLLSPSEWTLKLLKDGRMSATDEKDFDKRQRLAVFIERSAPVNSSRAYIRPEAYLVGRYLKGWAFSFQFQNYKRMNLDHSYSIRCNKLGSI